MPKFLMGIAVGLLLVLVSCGSDDEVGSGDPVADAFADQLANEASFPWFQSLDRTDTECFAVTALDTIGEQRQAELRFSPDNIPLLFEANWTDIELDALTRVLDACVDDNAAGTEAYVLSLFGGVDRYSDCLAPEIITALGDQYWLQQFRSGFTPPRVEMNNNEAARLAQEAGDESTPPGFVSDIEPIFEKCDVPGYGDNADDNYAEDACGGEPCEDPPNRGDFRGVVLECSRDPYVDTSFYGGPGEFDDWFPSPDACQAQGRGTLIAVHLQAYPCPQGPRDIKVPATSERITQQAVTDVCANVT
jgi:hypothetical protein